MTGATTSYIRRLCNTFYSNLIETGEQFEKAFPDNFQCFSGIRIFTLYLHLLFS